MEWNGIEGDYEEDKGKNGKVRNKTDEKEEEEEEKLQEGLDEEEDDSHSSSSFLRLYSSADMVSLTVLA